MGITRYTNSDVRITFHQKAVHIPNSHVGFCIYGPRPNHLEAALPAAVYERQLPDLELVVFQLGWAVSVTGDRLRYVYFPITAIISLLCDIKDGVSTQIAAYGNDGLIGNQSGASA